MTPAGDSAGWNRPEPRPTRSEIMHPRPPDARRRSRGTASSPSAGPGGRTADRTNRTCPAPAATIRPSRLPAVHAEEPASPPRRRLSGGWSDRTLETPTCTPPDGGPHPDPAHPIFSFLRMDAKNSRPADLNDDRVVDDLDLNLLLQACGTAGTTDLSGTGVTDGADLGRLLATRDACAPERPAPPPRLAPDRRPRTGFRRLAARGEPALPPRSVGERRRHRP